MRRLIALFAILVLADSSAQLVAPQLKTITMRDGLSSDHIQCMAADRRGYLWIGTSNGLNRFDGKRVKIYRTGGMQSIPSDLIIAMAVANDGLLYIGTSAPYLTVLDPLADTLTNIPIPIPAFSAHGEQRVNRIHIDRKGRIWVAHGARCLSLFDPSSRAFTTTEIPPPLPSPRSREVVIGINEDAAGVLWISAFKGLVRFDPETRVASPVHLHPAAGSPGAGYAFQVRGVADDDSCLIIGTWSEGIFRMRKRDGEVRLLWPEPDHEPTFVDHMVQDMLRGPGSMVHVATIDQGLLQIDLGTGMVQRYDRSLAEERCRSSNPLCPGASRLMRMDDALCIGTYTNGLYIWSTRANLVRSCQLPPHGPEEETDEVFAVHRDARTGNLLVQSHHRGLFEYDSAGSALRHRFHRPGADRRYYQQLWLDAGRLLMCSKPHALAANLRTGTVERPRYLRESTPCGGMLWWARGDGDHGLWCLTGSMGLHHVDTITGRCVAIADTLPELARKLGTWPWDVFRDRAGRQWFLSATTPPVVLHPDGSIEAVSGPASLAPFEVSDMAETPDGRLWFAVKHTGLAMLQADAAITSEVKDMSASLNSRNITEMAAMRDGGLWMTVPNALQHFDPAMNRSTMITVADGLPSGPLNLSPVHEPLEGPLIVGTWEGFFTVRREALVNDAPPTVQIPRMFALDSLIATDVDLSKGGGIELAHDLDRLTFLLRSTNLIDRERDEFAFRLIGSDSAWTLVGDEDRVTFNYLPPGEYRFEVKARTAKGYWGPASVAEFRILPPFWATWWFRSAMVLGLAACSWLVFRAVLRARLRKHREQLDRERALLEERVRIAHDLHDDLGSSLALIAMEGELASMDGGHDPREALKRVSEGAREVTDNMRRIVWALGSGQDTLGDLVAYIRSSAAELLERAEIELESHAEINTPMTRLSADQRRHLLLIAKELLLNVVKHSHARQAVLHMVQRHDHLIMTVADDGRGFDADLRLGSGTGTVSVAERVKALGGAFGIESTLGAGTTARIEVPLAAV